MDRALVPEAVEIHQPALQYMEESKAYHILKRWVDGGTMGVVSGLTVTVGSTNNTLIDIAAGHGYAPNGELVEATAAVTGVSLSNYGAGIDNYVCLVYTEVSTHPEAVATGGRTAATRAARSFRTRVFTLTELNALVATSTDMSVDARDRTLVVAVVNANGPAVALVSADITNAGTANRVLTMTQPTNSTGVSVLAISNGTPTTAERVAAGDIANSQAQIEVTTGATPPGSVQARYKAPGDTTFGSYVVIGAGGSPFTLASATASRTILLSSSIPVLPQVALTTTTDTLTVSEMYVENPSRGGARDESHRRVGTVQGAQGLGALPSAANPHGALIKNLSAIHEIPQTLFLGTQVMSTQAHALVPRLHTTQVSTVASTHTLLWQIQLDGTTRCVRFYVNNSRTLVITVNARWTGFNWAKDDTAQAASKFAIFDSGITSQARTAADPNTFDDTQWTNVPFFIAGLAGTAGEVSLNGLTQLGNSLLGTLLGRDTARLRATYDNPGGGGQQKTLLFESHRSGLLDDERVLRIYRSNTATLVTDGIDITLNARWDTTNNNWLKGNAAASASKIEIGRNFIIFYQRAGANGQFVVGGGDVTGANGWDTDKTHTFNLDLGTYAAQGDIFVNGTTGFVASGPTSEYTFGSARTYYNHTPGGIGQTFPEALGAVSWGQTGMVRSPGVASFNAGWPVRLPNGATITAAHVLFTGHIRTAGSMTVQLYRVRGSPTPVTTTTLATLTISSSLGAQPGYVSIPAASLPDLVDGANDSHVFAIDEVGSNFTYSVIDFRVTYTLPRLSSG